MCDADRKPRVRVKIIILVIVYFFGFFFVLFFESNQHSEGIKCEDDNEG